MAEPEETPGGEWKYSSLWVRHTSFFLTVFQMLRDQGNAAECLYLLFSSLEMWSNYASSKKDAALI